MPHWIWFLAPILIGMVQPIIWQMTIRLAKTAGDMPAAAILHLIGALVGGAFMISGLRGGNGLWDQVPWWAWLGGAIGVCCLWLLNMTVPRLGIATVMSILVASQLIAGLVFEKYGWLGAELRETHWSHYLGVVFLAVGAWLVSRGTEG